MMPADNFEFVGSLQGFKVFRALNVVKFVAKMAIDDDGSDNRERDPDWQADTSWHEQGKPLDARTVSYIVVPPFICNLVKPRVLGSVAQVSYGGKTVKAVVGDIGPRLKLGEASMCCARMLGINPSPTRGGVDVTADDLTHGVKGVSYVIYCGVNCDISSVTHPEFADL